MLLNPFPIALLSPFSLPADNPPNDLYIYDSVLVLVVYFVFSFLSSSFFFFLDSVADSCEFFIILMFMVLIFFLNKSL